MDGRGRSVDLIREGVVVPSLRMFPTKVEQCFSLEQHLKGGLELVMLDHSQDISGRDRTTVFLRKASAFSIHNWRCNHATIVRNWLQHRGRSLTFATPDRDRQSDRTPLHSLVIEMHTAVGGVARITDLASSLTLQLT